MRLLDYIFARRTAAREIPRDAYRGLSQGNRGTSRHKQDATRKTAHSNQRKIPPIGHVALDTHISDYAEKVELDFPKSGAYWVKSLYVSYTLQGLGIGGVAMNIAERMAIEEPLNARHLLLDTVHHEDQADEDFAVANYGGAFKIPTQAWYERRGYRLIGVAENVYQYPDANGKIWPCRTVFLQKDIV
ncbi:uncharacterized protein LW94_13612 [Fusarium fujikuroi]|nr:uncharacterized protein LW94_13612 [Fusarium fujikuroi]